MPIDEPPDERCGHVDLGNDGVADDDVGRDGAECDHDEIVIAGHGIVRCKILVRCKSRAASPRDLRASVTVWARPC